MGDLAAPLVDDDARPLIGDSAASLPPIVDSAASLQAKPPPTNWTLGGSFRRACGKVRDLGTMDGAVLLAFVASIGNMLQGWDNASIAGAMFYIKEEFNLNSMPMVEGCIMAMALFGATIITTLSGLLSDRFGRWIMLLTSAVLSLVSALLVIFCSQHVYMLLFARLIQGFSIGLAVTLVPLYIVETAPCDMRGKLSTFPQLSGSAGMFLSYCMVFWMSILPNVSWRVMLGIQLIPSGIYSILIIFYLPETPSWLVSQGRVDEAKKVLQRLRKKEDVSGEMVSLLESTRVGDQAPSMEKYLISTKEKSLNANEEIIKLYGLPEDLHCVAYPMKRQNTEDSTSRGASFYDPIVNITRSFHGNILEEALNIFDELEKQGPVESDEENQEYHKRNELEHHRYDGEDSELEQLIEPKAIEINNLLSRRKSGYIGGGWQLAWKMPSEYCLDGQVEGDMERVYLHEGGVSSSENDSLDVPESGNLIKATALVNKSVFHKDETGNHNIDFCSPEKGFKSTKWKDLLEPGVKRALVLGVGIQVLQQFAGINGILYYTPQILEQAGVGILLSKIGINPSSVSILMSALTTLLMLPFICIAMWLMDRTGRRQLLIVTIPILVLSLIVLVTVNIVNLSAELHALLSTISVATYFCIFVMGFGPIPNIFCSEIFPNKVRAICLALCSLTFWICDIIVTYTLPVLLRYIGLAGVFGVYAIVCVLSFVFVYFKMPETKGIPIEVMAEIFALGASHPSQQKEVLSLQKEDLEENENRSHC